MYTIQQRVEIVDLFSQNNDNVRAAAYAFIELHRNSYVSHTYVGAPVREFQKQDLW